jgi:Zn-dependent protease with chaperone function
MNCPLCGLANPASTPHCLSCGMALPAAPATPAPSAPSAPAANSSEPDGGALRAAAALPVAAGLPLVAPGVMRPAGAGIGSEPRTPPAPDAVAGEEAGPIPSRLEEPSVYAPVLGPADRESFFAAQRRHRRATWRLTAVCALAAVVAGIPLSMALTPVIYAVVIVMTKLVDILLPVPQAVWDAYHWAGSLLPKTIDALDNPETPGVSEGDISLVPRSLLLSAIAIWLAPGILLMLFFWPILRRLFEHGGVGGVLLTLGAREPNLRDFEERQLVNVVEEMAIAAGLPAPQVRLLDSGVANAAVVGSSRRDATIVVSRSLLEDLNRDETQGVLAHLIASIGNGDLRGARSIIAIFETFGLATLIMKTPISRGARRGLWQVVRYLFSNHPPERRAEEARTVAGLLSNDAFEQEDDDFAFLNESSQEPKERPGPSVRLLLGFPFIFIVTFIVTALLGFSDEMIRLSLFAVVAAAVWIVWYQREYVRWAIVHGARMARVIVMLPYYIGVMMPQMILMIVIPFVLEPLIALLWRTRRYLADASAVQLTRNPDGVAGGLTGLVRRGGIVPGGHWAAPLFVVGPEAVEQRLQSEHQQRIQERMAAEAAREGKPVERLSPAAQLRAASAVGSEHVAALLREEQEREQAHKQRGKGSGYTSFGGDSDPIISFHPPLNRRLNKLRRMGASVRDVAMRGGGVRGVQSIYSGGMTIAMSLLVVVLLAIAAVLMVVVIVLMLGLSLLFCGIMMLVVYGLLLVVMP